MPQWEYKVIAVPVGVVFTDYTTTEQKLNELGDEGWELVSTALGQKFVFKRENLGPPKGKAPERSAWSWGPPSAPPK